MRTKDLSLVGAHATLLVGIGLISSAAFADCTSPDSFGAVTCSGTIDGGINYQNSSVTSVTIQDLTSDIVASDAVTLSSVRTTPDDGSLSYDFDAASLSVTAELETGHQIFGTNTTMSLTSTGAGGLTPDATDRGSTATYGFDATGGGVGGDLDILVKGGQSVSAIGTGIIAVSTGGSGGTGGEADADIYNAHGGVGGDGGDGGFVAIELTDGAYLSVDTNTGYGLYASSQAGAGGNGGYADAGGWATGYGGQAGAAGSGGNLTILATDANNTIATSQNSGHAILMQTFGNIGGTGGGAEGDSAEAGDGGVGGAGGSVYSELFADITLKGDFSQGVWARSYGGNGGDGGSGAAIWGGGSAGGSQDPGDAGDITVNFGGSITTSGILSNAVLLQSVGGFAGDNGELLGSTDSFGADSTSGGSGGVADIRLNGATISTTGAFSSGVIAQSVGGGGGTGTSVDNGFEALGGDGSSGGNGHTASVDISNSTITTTGFASNAAVAMSAGGGGGVGGSTSSFRSIGGNGGLGGDGGSAILGLTGSTIKTTNNFSQGLVATSIGGGGGIAVSSSAVEIIGGDGGDGGQGGYSYIGFSDSASSVETQGFGANGIFVQSVGGGGGAGGASFSLDGVAQTRVGGAGGSGGNGDTATYKDFTDVSVSTGGMLSRGIIVQSVGGGGGQGGSDVSVEFGFSLSSTTGGTGGDGGAGGDGGIVTYDGNADVSTSGPVSTGILAQSIGGGGGASGNAMDISLLSVNVSGKETQVGGDGGNGGNGKSVSVTSGGVIRTTGPDSDGIIGQSVGGGGGASGDVFDMSIASVNLAFDGDALTAVGATGGAGGDGGAVAFDTTGIVSTSGDNSTGILAQSIGGGGGKAGSTTSVDELTVSTLNTVVGQGGGDGGKGSNVDMTAYTEVTTSGNLSPGILAQSIGGSGGSGGTVVSVSVLTAGLNLTLGGDGGAGGGSGPVTIDNFGAITTNGMVSPGIIAQSTAGGGGNGGTTVSGSVSIVSADVTLGSDGGEGADAGAVQIGNYGAITTADTFSFGILGQSIGGQGGNAGLVTDVSVDIGVVSGAVDVALGGDGGTGGNGDTVSVANNAALTTNGFFAPGVISQSIGGQGGTGGTVVVGQLTISEDGSADVSIGVGGDGGAGGASDRAYALNTDTITTTNHLSDGMIAQSISGNGGVAGASYAATLTASGGSTVGVDVQVGGDGGDGGQAGDAEATNFGTITTSGGNSNGIFVQSIGGSGGDGGSAVALLGNFGATSSSSFNASVTTSVGGTGGIGNHGGAASVSNSGTITTNNDVSRAIVVQSIGGGGGDGGTASQYTLGYTKTSSEGSIKSFRVTTEIGGDGGSGGDASTVTTSNTGTLNTSGIASYGILAQSIGGGGGNANDGSMDVGGWMDADTAAVLEDYLEQAKQAASEIKDPTSVFTKFSIVVAGNGGAAGDGDDVTVTNSGTISTSGLDGTAIVAQSIGGGGGAGADATQGLLLNATVAGDGSNAGDGADVSVTNSGRITTSNDRAMGILAQTIGGGGGTAGDVEVTFFNKAFDLNVTSGMSSDAGGEGDGGDVTIVSSGAISTDGMFAHGIFAQSAGGGGGGTGTISLDADGTITGYEGSLGSVAGTGDGGSIDITVDGSIDVSGDYAVGVFAQTVGGTAVGTFGTTGHLNIDIGGSVSATGQNGRAIFAQVDGPDEGGDMYLTIDSGGTVSSTNGSDGYDTVTLFAGEESKVYVENNGTLENLSTDESSYALYISSDALASSRPMVEITNNGTLTGSVYLDTEKTYADLTNTGTFNTGSEVHLGILGASSFVSPGTLSPGGLDNTRFTTITAASQVDLSGGTYLTDLYWEAAYSPATTDEILADLFYGEFSSLDVSGMVVTANILATTALPTDLSGSATIIAAPSEVPITGMAGDDAASVVDTATVNYSLSQELLSGGDYNVIKLNYEIDYEGVEDVSLGATSAVFGSFLAESAETAATGSTPAASSQSAAYAAASSVSSASANVSEAELQSDPERPVITEEATQALTSLAVSALRAPTQDHLERLYLFHSVEEAAVGISTAHDIALSLSDTLQSCPQLDHAGSPDFLRQQDCYWLLASGNHFEQDRTGHNPGFERDTYGLTGGVQRELVDGMFIATAVSYDDINIDGENFKQDGSIFSAGAALKRETGPWTFSVGAAGGYFDTDLARSYSTVTGVYSANGSPKGWFGSVEGRVSGLFQHSGFYSRPSVALFASHTRQNGFSETGDGLLNWQVDGINHTSAAIRPGLEIGRSFSAGDRRGIVFARAGATAYLTDPDYRVTARYQSFGEAFSDHTVSYVDDKYIGQLELGADVQLSQSLNISTLVGGSLSENTRSFGGSFKLIGKF